MRYERWKEGTYEGDGALDLWGLVGGGVAEDLEDLGETAGLGAPGRHGWQRRERAVEKRTKRVRVRSMGRTRADREDADNGSGAKAAKGDAFVS